jgi:hypothetical protein
MENGRFYYALKTLVDLSKEAQDALKEQKERMHTLSWAREICTIKASTARRMGHTTSINRLVLKNKMNVIYLAPREMQVRQFNEQFNTFRKDFRSYNLENSTGKIYDSFSFESFEQKTRGKIYENLDAIVVDNSYFLSTKKRDMIYEIGMSLFSQSFSENYFFIFIQ